MLDVVILRYLKVYYTKMMQIILQICNILLSTIVVKSNILNLPFKFS